MYRRYILKSFINPFLPTVPTFAVRETNVSRHDRGTSGAPLKPLRDDSALIALSFVFVFNVSTSTEIMKKMHFNFFRFFESCLDAVEATDT